jgi:hypothetical protein
MPRRQGFFFFLAPWPLGVKYVRLQFQEKMRNLLHHEGNLEEKERLFGGGY